MLGVRRSLAGNNRLSPGCFTGTAIELNSCLQFYRAHGIAGFSRIIRGITFRHPQANPNRPAGRRSLFLPRLQSPHRTASFSRLPIAPRALFYCLEVIPRQGHTGLLISAPSSEFNRLVRGLHRADRFVAMRQQCVIGINRA